MSKNTFICMNFRIDTDNYCKCNNKSVIHDVDRVYCKECFELQYDYLDINTIQDILLKIDPIFYLSTSKKIQYILLKNKGFKMTAREIYKKGEPWNITGLTPLNTLTARCSTLFKGGYINKSDNMFFI